MYIINNSYREYPCLITGGLTVFYVKYQALGHLRTYVLLCQRVSLLFSKFVQMPQRKRNHVQDRMQNPAAYAALYRGTSCHTVFCDIDAVSSSVPGVLWPRGQQARGREASVNRPAILVEPVTEVLRNSTVYDFRLGDSTTLPENKCRRIRHVALCGGF